MPRKTDEEIRGRIRQVKRDIFTVDQRVTLTQVGLDQGLQGRAVTPHGTVRALLRKTSGLYLRVQREGIESVETYWPSFWRPL